MPRISLDGFRDRNRRARYILWTGAIAIAAIGLVIVALGVTSTRWFCIEGCHTVQDDSIFAYQASAHANISCMACHMPVNAGPVEFLLHKTEALGELYLTVTGRYSLPLNPHSEIAFEMPAEQCTQCHTLHSVSPQAGLLIDHDAHLERGVACTVCHNRVAHVEDFELTLTDPQTGKPNRPHDDFRTMDGCFRCHVQQGEGVTGRCDACHTADFELRPESHSADGFTRRPGADVAVHAELARAEGRGAVSPEAGEGGAEGAEGEAAEDAHAEEHEVAGFTMKPLSEIDYCATCHADSFCTDCHGTEIPHPADFAQTHSEDAADNEASCNNCHLTDAAGMNVCDECHHQVGNVSQAWMPQHDDVVRADGAQPCFDCHDPRFCSACHVGLGR